MPEASEILTSSVEERHARILMKVKKQGAVESIHRIFEQPAQHLARPGGW